jgi:hypothetical protein
MGGYGTGSCVERIVLLLDLRGAALVRQTTAAPAGSAAVGGAALRHRISPAAYAAAAASADVREPMHTTIGDHVALTPGELKGNPHGTHVQPHVKIHLRPPSLSIPQKRHRPRRTIGAVMFSRPAAAESSPPFLARLRGPCTPRFGSLAAFALLAARGIGAVSPGLNRAAGCEARTLRARTDTETGVPMGGLSLSSLTSWYSVPGTTSSPHQSCDPSCWDSNDSGGWESGSSSGSGSTNPAGISVSSSVITMAARCGAARAVLTTTWCRCLILPPSGGIRHRRGPMRGLELG